MAPVHVVDLVVIGVFYHKVSQYFFILSNVQTLYNIRGSGGCLLFHMWFPILIVIIILPAMSIVGNYVKLYTLCRFFMMFMYIDV